MKKRGCLINFEGLDKSGKTTQSESLLKFLKEKGQDAVLFRFPIRTTETGKKIDKYLKNEIKLDDKTVCKLFSDNRRDSIKDIKSHLEKGTHVILDRYSLSGIAYSSARGLTFEECKEYDHGLIAPDIVIFISVSIGLIKERLGFGNEVYENEEFQKKVLENYYKLRDKTWVEINGSLRVEWIESIIHDAIEYFIDGFNDCEFKYID